MANNKWNIDDDESLYEIIMNLEKRVNQLENENVGTTNTLYEILNTLETMQWHYQNQ